MKLWSRNKPSRPIEKHDSSRFLVFLPPYYAARQGSLMFGFRGGLESADKRGTKVGEIRYSPIASIWVLRGRLAYEAKLGASTKLRRFGFVCGDWHHCSR